MTYGTFQDHFDVKSGYEVQNFNLSSLSCLYVISVNGINLSIFRLLEHMPTAQITLK